LARKLLHVIREICLWENTEKLTLYKWKREAEYSNCLTARAMHSTENTILPSFERYQYFRLFAEVKLEKINKWVTYTETRGNAEQAIL